ncbi:lambda family phage portal protein [Nitrosospira sp. Nsp2]|uniref:phage portal protein n=1 Tax=Nitrosospira sp. Nsp2 TaxID=136548 RepID=UPI000D30505E|nr:phage portal protein [Nitrosospira sp. Nsp2]PTR17489.1 lambda family phage portal protein [Nitrosospira sp. Nsp2]
MKFAVKVGRKQIEINENLVDRAVRYFNPAKAQRRMQARLQMEALSGGSSYTGASKSRRGTSEWRTTSNSADADLLPDLPTLRERSRDLVRNAPLASGAINTVVTNVIGTGLSLQSRVDHHVLGMTEEQASEWQTNTEREFRMWCESADCDITRTQNFYELQDLAFRSALESGDSFAVLPHIRRPGDAYGLKIQVVEGDRVSNPSFAMDKLGLAGGVEMDDTGAPVAYHILTTHPGDFLASGKKWDRIEAFGKNTGRRNVLHLFKRVRPGQNRGAPYLAPVIESLKQLDRYTEAEIMAAVVSGMFTVFVHSEGQGLDPANQMGMGAETGARASDTDVKMSPGSIIDLGVNEKIETANPGRPNTAFDPFVQAILRQVGVALELPFEILIKHFTASYSAARAAMLEAWKFFRVRRDWLAARFCQPIYETFLAEAIASGRISAPGYFDDPVLRAAYSGSEWIGDVPGQIDPLKEVQAAKERIAGALSNHSIETMQLHGLKWEPVHTQLAKEIQDRKDKGTLIDLQPEAFGDVNSSPNGSGQTSQPSPNDERDTEEAADKAETVDESALLGALPPGDEAYKERIAELSTSLAQLSEIVASLQAQKPQSFVEQIERGENGEIVRIVRTAANGHVQIENIERDRNNEIIRINRTTP